MKHIFHPAAVTIFIIIFGYSFLNGQQFPPEDNPAERLEYERAMTADPSTGTVPQNIRNVELQFAKELTENAKILRKKSESSQAFFWSQRGPDNVGGRTRALAIDIANSRNLIAGCVMSGLWRSIDAGNSWVRTSKNDQNIGVTAIAQDKRSGKTNVWYAGSGEWAGISGSGSGGSNNTALVARYNGDGIFKSTDNGASWFVLPATQSNTPQKNDPFDFVYRLATDPSRMDDRVFAATIGGIWLSTNGGTSWKLTLGDTIASRMSAATDVVVSDDGIAYATLSTLDITGGRNVTTPGVFRSTDGVTWTKISPASFGTTFQRLVPALAPGSQHIMYILGSSMLYRYDARTGTWTNRSANLPRFSGLGGMFSTQGVWNIAIAVQPGNPDVVVIGGTSVYRSTDGFQTSNSSWIGGYNPDYAKLPEPMNWRDMMYPKHHPDIHLLFFDNANLLYSADDGGIHSTNNPLASTVTWKELNTGYFTGMHYTVAVQKKVPGSTAVITGLQDNSTFGSPADGKPWQWLAGGDGSFGDFLGTSNSGFITSAQGGYLCYTSVDSSTYIAYNIERMTFSGLSGGNGEGHLFNNPFIIDKRYDSIAYLLTTTRIIKHSNLFSPNRANLWKPLFNQHLSSLMLGSEVLSSMDQSIAGDSSKLVVGTNRGKVFLVENIDKIPTVRLITGSNFPASGGYLQCVAFDPSSADKIFAVFANYNIPSVFYTEDGGKTWEDVGGNMEEKPDGTGAGPSCRWIKIIRNNNKVRYLLGTSIGLFSTQLFEGSSTVWEQEGALSIGNAVVTMIDTRESDGYTAVATHGRGIFTAKMNLSDTGSNSADGFQLEECYPNPAKDYSLIRFSLPRTGSARLMLYDAIGRKVSVIVEGELPQGLHVARIETAVLAQGVYFCHLDFEGRTQTVELSVAK